MVADSVKLTGEDIEELKQLGEAHFWPHSRPIGDMSDETGIKLISKAEGVWVEDGEGNRWVDTLAGMWLKNIGHGRKEIAEAVYQQMQDVSYSPGGTVSPATVRLAAKVASLSPDPDSRVYFVSGGSEAVETALKIAKAYHKNNGEPTRYKVISRRGSYHGATHACMALGGSAASGPQDYGPLVPGNIHIAQPNKYRGPHTDIECAEELERTILHEGPHTVAAFIGEPISAAAGIHIPDSGYWPRIREICDKYGVIMICDEVITGFGRTGKMFATEHWDIQPDIFTVAKALTSGYLPIGAAVASKKVADNFMGQDNMLRHLITFGGNPASCAAGLANLEIMENEDVVQNSAEMGDYLYEQLQTLYEHPIVGDVRGGMGLICGIEIVKDRDTKERFPAEANLGPILDKLMSDHGLLGRAGDVIALSPPLTITRDEVDFVVRQLDSVLEQAEAQLGAE
ncbi:MAG: aspartate aminotransferase family protein [Dehalococcoidia bacterium]|nr:aspartate aminotransferase family protein [Dehalococcoidia bacterium]